MTQLYEVVKEELKYAGKVYQRGDLLKLIGSRYDGHLVGRYVRKYESEDEREVPRKYDEILGVDRCIASTASGNQCKRDSLIDSEYCGIHKKKMEK